VGIINTLFLVDSPLTLALNGGGALSLCTGIKTNDVKWITLICIIYITINRGFCSGRRHNNKHPFMQYVTLQTNVMIK
jgi:hypothetical protein